MPLSFRKCCCAAGVAGALTAHNLDNHHPDDPHTDVPVPGEGVVFTMAAAGASSGSSARAVPGTRHALWTGSGEHLMVGRHPWVESPPYLMYRR